MNAVYIAVDNVVELGLNSDIGLAAGPVALSAQSGNVAGKGRRGGYGHLLDVVLTMAVQTVGSVGITLRVEGAVQSELIVGHRLRMADAAIDLVLDGLARPFSRRRDFGMALGASGCGVGRGAEAVLVYGQGDRLSVALHCQIGVAVAGQAVFVGHAGRIEDAPDLVR